MAAIRRPAFEETSCDVALSTSTSTAPRRCPASCTRPCRSTCRCRRASTASRSGPLAQTPTPARTPGAHPRRAPPPYALAVRRC